MFRKGDRADFGGMLDDLLDRANIMSADTVVVATRELERYCTVTRS
jgi:hypothetical protein